MTTFPDDKRCTATAKRSGERCQRAAIPGGKVCIKHGGTAPQVKAAAERRLAEARAAASLEGWGLQVDINPAEALLELVQTKAAEVYHWRHLASNLLDDERAGLLVTRTEEGVGQQGPIDTVTKTASTHVYVTMLHKAEADLARYAEAAIRSGATQAMVDMARKQGAATVDDFRRLIIMARDDLTVDPDQLILTLLEG